MKRYALFIFLAFCFSYTYAQNFELRGLEIYNPAYFNPAFTSSEKMIQTDLIAYDFVMNNGYWLGAMSSIPNTNSSLGISFSGHNDFKGFPDSNRSDADLAWHENKIKLAYAYKYSFAEYLHLSGGASLRYSTIKYIDPIFPEQNELMFSTGIKLKYYGFYVGLSAGTKLYTKTKPIYRSLFTNSYFVAGYTSSGKRRVTISPIIGYAWEKNSYSGETYFGYYVGAKIVILKTVGLGFTLRDMFSITASISIRDYFDLVIGLYQSEKDTFSIYDYNGLRFNPVEFIAQLRIKI